MDKVTEKVIDKLLVAMLSCLPVLASAENLSKDQAHQRLAEGIAELVSIDVNAAELELRGEDLAVQRYSLAHGVEIRLASGEPGALMHLKEKSWLSVVYRPGTNRIQQIYVLP